MKMSYNGIACKLVLIVRVKVELHHETMPFIGEDLRECGIHNLLRWAIKNNLTIAEQLNQSNTHKEAHKAFHVRVRCNMCSVL